MKAMGLESSKEDIVLQKKYSEIHSEASETIVRSNFGRAEVSWTAALLSRK